MILGINDMVDPSVSLVEDGKLLFYVEEERLNRIKHSHNIFPIKSIETALKKFNISVNDLECIAYNWNFNKYSNGHMANIFRDLNSKYDVDPLTKKWQSERLKNRNLANFKKKLELNLRKKFNFSKLPPIKFFSHHYVHAYQSHLHSGFEKSLCITIDGSGEENCTVVWKIENDKITKLKEINMPNSLGWYYAAFTEYLGFKAYDGEYKLMGLASYGKNNSKLEKKINKVIGINNLSKEYSLNPKYIHYGAHSFSGRFTDNLVKLFGKKPRKENEKITDWHKDLAFEVQKKLEDSVFNLFQKYSTITGIKNFTMGGGVGLNVKMNSKIFESSFCDKIFPNPLCADNGAAVGSALIADYILNKKRPKELKSLALGPDYSDKEIVKILKLNKIKFYKINNIEKYVAKELAKGQVIGWFQGKMEAGARALGQRSILGDPRNKKMTKKINLIIKYREVWRPFCPSILEEYVEKYFIKSYRSNFMTISFEAKKELKNIAPAIVHVDNTSRVQSVSKKYNLKFYKLINGFFKITKVPILLNTSFNVKGEPIVCSPNDAIRTFYSTGLDQLVLNNFLIKKK